MNGKRILNAAIALLVVLGLAIQPHSALAAIAPAHTQLFAWADGGGLLGTAGVDFGKSVAVDDNGNVYFVGQFDSSYAIAKFDKFGVAQWLGALSTSCGEIALSASPAGDVYITGCFIGTNVDINPDLVDTHYVDSAGSYDIFITKLDTDGNFIWGKTIGAADDQTSTDIVATNTGLYITGDFRGTGVDFDPGAGSSTLNSNGDYDTFVLNLDSDGVYQWAKNFGGTNSEFGRGIAVDWIGDVYVTGDFYGSFTFHNDTLINNSIGSQEAFVAKLSPSGVFSWARQIGSNTASSARSLAVDVLGNIYATGTYEGGISLGSTNLTSTSGSADIFVTKIQGDGTFDWAASIGNANDEANPELGLDSNNNIYLAGSYSGTVDFDPSTGTFNLSSHSNSQDVFVGLLDSDGTFIGANGFGGNDTDEGVGLAVDSRGNTLITGGFRGTADFDPGSGVFNLTGNGNSDIFVSKLGLAYSFEVTSNKSQDGWVLESSENSNSGGAKNNKSSTLYIGDDAANRQYRSILSFDTASLPDDAVVTSVILSAKNASVVGGGNPVKIFKGFALDINSGDFGSASLALSDFNASASHTYPTIKPALLGPWYDFDLKSAASYINLTGNTQIRLRFKNDDNNNSIANYLKLYSGNAGAANAPQLSVEYYLP